MGEEALKGVPVLVLANKQDLLNAMTAAELMGPDGLDIAQFTEYVLPALRTCIKGYRPCA